MQKRFFVTSLLGHILIAGLLLLRLEKPVHTPVAEVTQIEFQEVVRPIKAKPIDRASGARKNNRTAGVAPAQPQLFPKTDLLAKVQENTEWAQSMNGQQKTAPQQAFNNSRTFISGADEIFGENGNQNWSYYQEVYRKIDSNLIFDSLLAQYNHFGRVYVQFRVSDEGLFQLDDLKADANDAILKVHVLRAIRKSLSEPLEPLKRSKLENDTVFQARFDFSLAGGSDGNFSKQRNFGKPVFVFRRTTIEKPIPRELMEHLLDGGVTPNVSLMIERWQKYNKRKYHQAIQFDPFESYRRDAFYEL